MLELERGKIIAIEGLDASGKNTNVNLLEEALTNVGLPVVVYRFPQYESEIGKVIANYLKGEYGDIDDVPYELVCTAYAADRARFAEDMLTYVDNGYIVLCDRYTYSNAFTVAKLPKEKWNDFISWIERLEFDCLGVAKPDYNIYLHVDPKISIQRIQERGKRSYQEGKEDIHEFNNQLLINTSEVYLKLAEEKDNWIVINQMDENGEQYSLAEVFSDLFYEVHKLIFNN